MGNGTISTDDQGARLVSDLAACGREAPRAPSRFEIEASIAASIDDLTDDDPRLRALLGGVIADTNAVLGIARLCRENLEDLEAIDRLCEQMLEQLDRTVSDDIDLRLRESFDEADAQLPERSGFSDPVVILPRSAFSPGPGRFFCKVVLAGHSPYIGAFDATWDILDLEVSDRRSAAIAAVANLAIGGARLVDQTPKRFWSGPLFKYHPHRFTQSRSYSRMASGLSGKMMSSDQFEKVVAAIQKDYMSRLEQLPRRLNPDNSITMMVDRETKLFDSYQRFRHNGRAIYDLDSDLVGMFRKTSIADVPMDMIKVPYVSIYLHFGVVEGWQSPDGWSMSGAYVNEIPEADALEIVLVWQPPDPAEVLHWPLRPEPVHKQTFKGETRHMDAATAIETLYAKRLFDLQEEGGQKHEQQVRDAQSVEADQGLAPGTLSIDSRRRARLQSEQLAVMQPIAANAMSVVINALLYLTMYPDDRIEAWPEGTPESLRAKAEDETAKQSARRKARSRLNQMGYQKVNLCGLEMRQRSLSQRSTDTGRISRHWRSGHWRRQPYGPGRRLMRMKWIMPVEVGSLQPDQDEAYGHIYHSRSPSSP